MPTNQISEDSIESLFQVSLGCVKMTINSRSLGLQKLKPFIFLYARVCGEEERNREKHLQTPSGNNKQWFLSEWTFTKPWHYENYQAITRGKLYINILDVSLEKLILKVHFNVYNDNNHRRGYQLDGDGEWERLQGGYPEGARERK